MSLSTRPLLRLSAATARWTASPCPTAPVRSRVPWTGTACPVQVGAAGRRKEIGGSIGHRIGSLATWKRDFSYIPRMQDAKMEERLRRIQEENAARVRKEEEEARVRAEQKAQQMKAAEEEEEATRRKEMEARELILDEQNGNRSVDGNINNNNNGNFTSSTITKSSAPATPAEKSNSLPSHAENRRSDLQKRASILLDDLLLKASILGQQVNQYTGTDYSGIEALRKEISSQEQKVRQLRLAVDQARQIHHDAYAQQTASQREIVALLERKSSWSPGDLERYMSLVRSEHLNEQSVVSAQRGVDEKERALEEARSLLERLERKQYHEEQIWSDTIRRNSTWVTFGLMGVNILLLLANIVVFEPWRRRKIAGDVKNLLEENTVMLGEVAQGGVSSRASAVAEVRDRGTQVDDSELRELEEFHALKRAELEQPLDKLLSAEAPAPLAADSASPTSGEMLPIETMDVVGAVPAASEELARSTTPMAPEETARSDPSTPPNYLPQPDRSTWDIYHDTFRDLFSDRVVHMRKVDITHIALQGAASGFAIMGLLFVLLRPK